MTTACIVDLNVASILVMVKGDPGIGRARLYRTPRGKAVFDTMVRKGLIEEKGDGCHLTEEGDRILEMIRELCTVFEDEDLVTAYISNMVTWYLKKTDASRERYHRR